jgi:hypothetical protein
MKLRKGGAIALCPGSRLPVLRRNLPAWLRLLDAAGLGPDTPLAVAVPPFLAAEAVRLARKHAPERWAKGGAAKAADGAGSATPGLQVRTDVERVLAEAPRALAFPGTITLELAWHRVPTLVLALVDPLTYALGRRLLAGRRLALPNLILGEELFPEWAGTSSGPEPAVFRALWEGLPASGEMDWERRLEDLNARLGPGDGARVAAEACLGILRDADLKDSLESHLGLN